ncbi:hypothetical protein [Tranquillimonas alkanivorans]|uniref:Uncharacterized protein n=1 Tax=Tranquillimonas alkanivorans TaxID=441119 RepID=A0A1I5Q7C0_9RHOB|nr:hypothetical protein [Tranquillimonas alkanivorans]SFP42214.1 hypothetical protein SAMN04488047_106103 [Tranquillimonas alkanivorans]
MVEAVIALMFVVFGFYVIKRLQVFKRTLERPEGLGLSDPAPGADTKTR